ncbi:MULTISPECIES: histidine kinase [Bacteria]|jgi:uncharacterized membrane protein YhaH (DUF805 family)
MQPETTTPRPIEANATTWTAAILVGLEGVAVAALTGWMMPSLIAGETTDLGTAWALILMTVIAAVALFAFALAILRGHGWGRSGAIVAQLLILAVALGAATGAYARPLVALALAVPAVIALVLVIAAARAAGRRDDPPAAS